ncbi:MAG TPA: hypothetical protein VKT82_11630 [Ktedonobacterales bacterium]|nr:hypothetical protein [Ktedonobacterales bacterium]
MGEHQHAWDYFTNHRGQWARRCVAGGCDRVEVAADDLNRDWEARARALEQQLAEVLALLERGNMLISAVLDETDDMNLSRVDAQALGAWRRAYATFLAKRQQ